MWQKNVLKITGAVIYMCGGCVFGVVKRRIRVLCGVFLRVNCIFIYVYNLYTYIDGYILYIYIIPYNLDNIVKIDCLRNAELRRSIYFNEDII